MYQINTSLLIEYKSYEKLLLILFVSWNSLLFSQNTSSEPIGFPATKESVSVPENVAQFPGGEMELKRFILENIKSPNQEDITGKVYVKFDVNRNGSINNILVIRGIEDCNTCSDEAIRLISTMPKWIPAKKNGISIDSEVSLSITFN